MLWEKCKKDKNKSNNNMIKWWKINIWQWLNRLVINRLNNSGKDKINSILDNFKLVQVAFIDTNSTSICLNLIKDRKLISLYCSLFLNLLPSFSTLIPITMESIPSALKLEINLLLKFMLFKITTFLSEIRAFTLENISSLKENNTLTTK